MKNLFISITIMILLLSISSCKKSKTNDIKKNKTKKVEKFYMVAPEFSEKPVFQEKSTNTIFLRYKFKKNEVLNFVNYLDMINDNKTKVETTIYGNFVVNNISDRGTNLTLSINRTKMDTKSKAKNINYDSILKSKEKYPKLQFFTLLKYTKTKFFIDNLGKVKEISISFDKIKETKLEDKVKIEITKRLEELIFQAFPLLSAKTIKTNESYLARKRDKLLFNLSSQKEFTLESISKDEKFALLSSKVKLDTSNLASEIKINENKVNAWTLFDISLGKHLESSSKGKLYMTVGNYKVKMNINSYFKILF